MPGAIIRVMGASQLIVERIAAPFAGSRVDRAKGVISGALICGPASANGNDYGRDAFGDGQQYAGRHVYLNHDHGQRRAEDKIGWFENIRFRSNGMPEGDFHVLLTHPMAGSVLEAAERNPSLFGFSHMAQCTTKPGTNGRTTVEAVNVVRSVDLVADPATTSGIFSESRTTRGGNVPTTIKQLAEGVARNPRSTVKQITKAKLLAEMDGMADVPVDAPADGDDANGQITAGFKAAFDAIRDKLFDGSMDKKTAFKKLTAIWSGHSDATDSGGGDADDPATEEGRRRAAGNAILEAIDVCESVQFAAGRADLEIVAAAAPDRRKAMAERLKKASGGSGGTTVESTSRAKFQPPAGTTTVAEGQGAGASNQFSWID